MGEFVDLTAADGHKLAAYRAAPAGQSKGGVVVIQEIFGVNGHIRSVCDGFAADGYVALAPAVFDRAQRGVELGYDEQGIETGREIAFPMGWEGPMLDVDAAAKALAPTGKVAAVGYCWGGSLAYLAACRLDAVACAAGYYGGQITKLLDANPQELPKVPVMLHFGKQDTGIPLSDVDRIRQANPQLPIHLYDAGHGFNCDQRGSWHESSSRLARERTLGFFAQHMHGRP